MLTAGIQSSTGCSSNVAEQNEHMAKTEVREGTFRGGIPYLATGRGEPLVYLCGFTTNHRNPKPGLERALTLRTVNPLARAGFEVYYTNRWPGMAADISFAEVAERHAEAIRDPLAGRWMCSVIARADR
jgi:hypothetical protein